MLAQSSERERVLSARYHSRQRSTNVVLRRNPEPEQPELELNFRKLCTATDKAFYIGKSRLTSHGSDQHPNTASIEGNVKERIRKEVVSGWCCLSYLKVSGLCYE